MIHPQAGQRKCCEPVSTSGSTPGSPPCTTLPTLPSISTFTMLARRLAGTSPFLARSLTTTSALRRTPSLADVVHDDAALFDARQNEFREAQKEAFKVKEQQDSQSVTGSAPALHSASAASSASTPSSPGDASGSTASGGASSLDAGGPAASIVTNIAAKLPLSSLSTAAAGAAREQASSQERSQRKGALASLIYGTKEGQQLDQEIERSFSQVLARGKYVHSIVFHDVKPDKVDEYVELVGGWYPKVASNPENHVNLVGSWRTEVGDCDTFGGSCSCSPRSRSRLSRPC